MDYVFKNWTLLRVSVARHARNHESCQGAKLGLESRGFSCSSDAAAVYLYVLIKGVSNSKESFTLETPSNPSICAPVYWTPHSIRSRWQCAVSGRTASIFCKSRQALTLSSEKFGRSTPFKVQLPAGITHFHTSGAEHVTAFFKGKGLSGNSNTTIALGHSFGAPRRAVEFYEADDSGHLPNPKPGCTVEPENRIMYDLHKLVNVNLSGESLTGITARFQKFLAQQLTEMDEVGDQWVDIPDLYLFMRQHVMKAATISMFGTYILSLNPTFIDDFWAWNPDMGPLFMGLPRWVIPSAYRNRTKVLDNIKRWHKYAHEHFDCNKVGPEDPDWEPYFGSKFSRKRQATLGRWKELDETAKAADDLSFMWG